MTELPPSSTTPDPRDRYRRVRVTHPFHPLCGQDFEFVVYRQNWGEDRVHLHDKNGQLFSLPAGWTDVVPLDPFVVIAAGRCPFTTDGLLALADLADRLGASATAAGLKENYAVSVNRIMPHWLARLTTSLLSSSTTSWGRRNFLNSETGLAEAEKAQVQRL